MPRLRTLALAVLLLPAAAFAQDAAPGGPTGALLLEAMPPTADLVVHVPNLPRFLASAPEALFGTKDAWTAAFQEQLRRWGADAGDSSRLVAAGERLLALADGECLVAGIDVPGAKTSPRDRAALVAFRSRARAADLRKAVDEVVAAGLRARWSGAPRVDAAGGREVTSIAGEWDGVSYRVEDGLVAFSESAAALGVLFRGLERVAQAGGPQPADAARRLEVRWGRDDARWTAWTYFNKESVSWRTKAPLASVQFPDADAPVLALSLASAHDVPVFPVAVPADVLARAPGALVLRADGRFALTAAAEPDARWRPPAIGWSSHSAWLRALRDGALPMPVPSVERELLDGPLAAVTESVREWKPGAEPGEIRGPAWSGPATLLALRVLGDIARGHAPGATDGDADLNVAPPKPGGALPPPPKTEPPPAKPETPPK